MKAKHKSSTLQTVLYIFFLVGWLSPVIAGGNKVNAKMAKTGESQVIIFHINDVHAQIDNFARIAWVIEEEKKNNPQAAVFFLNGGDNFSGNAVVDQYNPKGEPIFRLMSRLGVAAMVLGNHEFDYGQDILKSFMLRAKFPILCANADLQAQDKTFPQPLPFTILKTPGGIKISVLGLIEVSKYSGIPSAHPSRLQGFTFSDPIETAKKYRYLKKESDIFIALTHLGTDTDEGLAGELAGLDVIVGGHSHTQVDPAMIINGVLVAQAGGNARFLGRIELILENRQLVKKSGRLIDLNTIKGEIPAVKEMITAFNNNPVINQVLVVLPCPAENPLEVANLVCNGLRKQFNLDIVFHNAGGIRVKRLNPTIKLKDIYALHPFENRMVQYKMNTAEIRSLITSCYERYKKPELLVSGIHYLVKHTPENKVKEVELKDEQGQLLDETKTYTVGMNDYMASSFSFTHQDPGQSLVITVNEALIQYLKQEKDICSGLKILKMHFLQVDQ
jgi:2',3'-cyclic-nucleotide 2'-phosphodiesterase (5'-nucleotidase family)